MGSTHEEAHDHILFLPALFTISATGSSIFIFQGVLLDVYEQDEYPLWLVKIKRIVHENKYVETDFIFWATVSFLQRLTMGENVCRL